jgi:SPX domain protein involved in polyphosphate accumulation
MKFGEHLISHKFKEWEDKYLDYDRLKKMIKNLEALHINRNPTLGTGGTSLSVPVPTNAAGIPLERPEEATQEQFYSFLEQEMKKIEKFTKETVRMFMKNLNHLHVESSRVP